ncbi:hypothetical protein HF086_000797 [Spodoptera exigua]|uniref:Uncharacterized protein n=1 Tax=Spodoptera exigua TaxID=7107 RepID=A0A922SJT6_SPOEX|nr:hypothetical protein HF086_000797 [Spodoptera exigua]
MGVPGAGGTGPNGARRPSHVAYYVALVGILSLLIMLCLYFFYFFIKKVKELSSSESVSLPTTSCRPPAAAAAYPVAPARRPRCAPARASPDRGLAPADLGADLAAEPAADPRPDKTLAAPALPAAGPELAAQ